MTPQVEPQGRQLVVGCRQPKALATIVTQPRHKRLDESGSSSDTDRIGIECHKFRIPIEPPESGEPTTIFRDQRRQARGLYDLSLPDNRSGIPSLAKKATDPCCIRETSRSNR